MDGDFDPDALHTGGSSAIFGNEEQSESTKVEKDKQRRQHNELIPHANDILNYIQEEKSAIADIRAYIKELGPKATKTALMDEYRARELYLGYLERFEKWMILRIAKKPSSPVLTRSKR